MAYHLYLIRIENGRRHAEWVQFHGNMTELGAKSDFGGIEAACVVKHHADAQSVHVLCTQGMRSYDDVTVEEITRASLRERHFPWKELVENYFLRYGSFPNL